MVGFNNTGSDLVLLRPVTVEFVYNTRLTIDSWLEYKRRCYACIRSISVYKSATNSLPWLVDHIILVMQESAWLYYVLYVIPWLLGIMYFGHL